MKKIVAVLLILSLACVNVPCSHALSGIDGEKEKWITSGIYQYEIKDEENKIAVLYKINSSESNIVIPETIDGYTIKYIGTFESWNEYVSHEDKNIMGSNKSKTKTLIIPNTVEFIGSHAFYGCNNLEKVSFPVSKTIHIGEFAFAQCRQLKNIKLFSADVKEGAFCIGSTIKRLELNSVPDVGSYPEDEYKIDYYTDTEKIILNGTSSLDLYEFCRCEMIDEIYVNDASELTCENGGGVRKLYLNGRNAVYKGFPRSTKSVLYTIPAHKKAISLYRHQCLTYHIKSTGSMKKVTRKKSGKKYRYTWKKVKTTVKTHKFNWDKGKWKKTKKNVATQYQIYGKAKKSDTYQLMKTTKKRKFTTKYKYVKVKPVKIWLE